MLKSIKSRILAVACVVAMIFSTFPSGLHAVYAADDIIADGIQKDFGTVDNYLYSYGWAAGATSEHKYLILTFSGDISNLRIQSVKGEERNGSILWFNQEQADHLTLVGTPTLSGDNQNVVVDLQASGIDMDNTDAFDLHYGPGTLKIGVARFSASSEVLLTDIMPKEEETTAEETTVEETTAGEKLSTDTEETTAEETTIDSQAPAEDLILNGDEKGMSSMIKSWTVSQSYKYLGFATLKEPTAAYNYLILTYAGDISTVRFEFANVDAEGNESNKVGPYWFNKDGQTLYFVTADGSDIALDGGKGTTVVIDLAASGIDISTVNSVHMHGGDPNVASFSLQIGMARLSTSADVKDIDVIPTEEETTTISNVTTTAANSSKVTIKKAKIKKLTAKKKSIKVTIKKLANAKKYKIQYSLKKTFKKSVTVTKTTKKLTYTIKKLRSKKTYYVRVAGVNGKITGPWSKANHIKAK
jgi:hypothetical protein